eukprot:1668641-Ditylum_brightwellii.AAC.1
MSDNNVSTPDKEEEKVRNNSSVDKKEDANIGPDDAVNGSDIGHSGDSGNSCHAGDPGDAGAMICDWKERSITATLNKVK